MNLLITPSWVFVWVMWGLFFHQGKKFLQLINTPLHVKFASPFMQLSAWFFLLCVYTFASSLPMRICHPVWEGHLRQSFLENGVHLNELTLIPRKQIDPESHV